MAPQLKIVLFFGSVRQGRLGFRLAKYLESYLIGKNFAVDLFGNSVCHISDVTTPAKAIKAMCAVTSPAGHTRQKQASAEFVMSLDTVQDPDVMQFPLLQKPVYHYENLSEAPKEQRDALDKIVSADGFVVVSAEYNHSIPPALSNMLDHFPMSAFNTKPCSIVTYSYGQYGGVRAAMQLRSFLGELGLVTPQFIFAVGAVHEALSEDGKPLRNDVETGAEKIAKQLEWYARTLKNGREQTGVPT